MIQIPLEIGDTILAGRFKNKRVTVKSIGVDEYGLPTVNGRGILKIRIEKLIRPKIEEISVARKINQREYKYYIFKDDELVEGFEYKDDAITRKAEMIVKEQSEDQAFDIGQTIPIRIKKDSGEYWIYRVNQNGTEVKALNRGFESKAQAERSAKLRGFVLVDDKYNVEEYESIEHPEAMNNRSSDLKTKEQKIAWVTEIIRKLIRESKVSKKKLNEATQTKDIDRAIEELSELEAQLADAKEQVAALSRQLNISALEKRYKQLIEAELWDFLEELKKDDVRVVRTTEILMTIKRFQAEKATYEYERVLDYAMTQVNQDVKEKILNELKAVERLSKVKPALSFSKSEGKLREANVFSKLADWIKSLLSGIKNKMAAKGKSIDKNLDKLEKILKI